MSAVERMQPSFDNAQFPDARGHLPMPGLPQLPCSQAHVHHQRRFPLGVAERFASTLQLLWCW